MLLNSSVRAQSADIEAMLVKVKEASYYDSTRVFTIGEKVISLAQQKNDFSAIAKVYVYYGSYFFYVRNLEKADHYFNQSVLKANEAGDESTALLASIRLAYLNFEKGQRERSIDQLSNYLSIARKKEDHKNAAEALNLIGIIKEYEGNVKQALTLYYEGLAFSEKHNLKYYPAVFRNNLGIIKMNRGNDSAAFEDFVHGLEIAQRDQDKRLASHIQMNMCILDVRRNKMQEASELFAQVLQYSKDNNLPIELSSNYINLATAFLNKNDGKTALSYYDSAIVILEKHQLTKELNEAYLGKANVLFQLNEIDKAYALLSSLKDYFSENQEGGNTPYYYYQLYQIFDAKHDHKNALENYIKYNDLRTTLDNKLNTKVIEELQQNYKVQQKEIELEKERTKTLELEKKNQEAQYIKWFIISFASAVIILIMVFSYVRYSRRLKEEQQLFSQQLIKNIEEERKRIARDLHDDIGQSLSMIKSKIVNERAKAPVLSETLEKELGSVIEQTREISRNLYPSNIEKIGLARSIAALMEAVQTNTRLECSSDISEAVEVLSIAVKTQIFRILQESVNNTIKHSNASGLKISIHEDHSQYTLVYQDNGKGFKVKKGYQGIGLLSIQERANIIGASIDFDDKQEKGFKFTLKFRINTN